MNSVTLRAHVDTYVEHDNPNRNHGQASRIKLRSDATSHGHRGLIFFPRPFPKGSTVTSAVLRLYLKGSWAGSNQITAKRIVERWKENRVTWDQQPSTVEENSITVTVVNGGDQQEVEMDLTDLFADVSADDDYHGLKLVLGNDVARTLYSSESPRVGTDPKLDVEWGQQPYPPSNLSPGGGQVVSIASPILSWRFSDHRGSTKQGSSQVQVSATSSFAGSLLFDSGWQTNARHEFPLVGSYALSDGQTVWWRSRVKDGAGLVSGWSDAVSFKRVTKGTLTITNPSGATVNDLTPPLTWTKTGVTDRVRAKLSREKANGTLVQVDDFEEQAVETTFASWTPKKGAIKNGPTYLFQLHVFDDEDRVATPGDPAYSYAEARFTYVRAGGPAAVTALTAVPFGPDANGTPLVLLSWTRATPPDSFCLRVNGVEVIPEIEPTEVQLTSTTYAMTFCRAVGAAASTYEVEAVVNKLHSSGNAQAVATTNVAGKYLVDEDDGLIVHLLGAEQADLPIVADEMIYRLPGNRRPVIRTASVGGHEGPIHGTLLPGVETDFLELYGRGTVLRYIQSNMNIPVRLSEPTGPTPDSSQLGRFYLAGGTIRQVAEFFDVEGFEEVNDDT